MAFHAAANVQSKFKKLVIGTASTITTAEVTDEITRTEAYVVGKIDPFYDTALIVEATAPVAFAIVKEICTLLTAGKLVDILRKNGVENPDENAVNRGNSMLIKAEKDLKGIMLYATEGNVPGALSLYDVAPRALGTTGAFTGQGTSVPYFKKDTEQW